MYSCLDGMLVYHKVSSHSILLRILNNLQREMKKVLMWESDW